MQTHYSDNQRSAILDEHITKYVQQGYQIIARTPTTCQLVKQKKFSFFWALIWLIIGVGIGFLIYLAWYMSKKGGSVYLQVDAGGIVHVTKS